MSTSRRYANYLYGKTISIIDLNDHPSCTNNSQSIQTTSQSSQTSKSKSYNTQKVYLQIKLVHIAVRAERCMRTLYLNDHPSYTNNSQSTQTTSPSTQVSRKTSKSKPYNMADSSQTMFVHIAIRAMRAERCMRTPACVHPLVLICSCQQFVMLCLRSEQRSLPAPLVHPSDPTASQNLSKFLDTFVEWQISLCTLYPNLSPLYDVRHRRSTMHLFLTGRYLIEVNEPRRSDLILPEAHTTASLPPPVCNFCNDKIRYILRY